MKTHDMTILNFADAQDYLGVSRSTLVRWIRDGRVHGYKAGRKWKFYRQDLDTMLVRESETPYGSDDGAALLRELHTLDIADTGVKAEQLKSSFWCEWQDRDGWLWLSCTERQPAAGLVMQPGSPAAPLRQWPLTAAAARQLAACWKTWRPGAEAPPPRPGRLETACGTLGDIQHVLSLSRHIDALAPFETVWARREAYSTCRQAMTAAPADWLVSGPPLPYTMYAAYALAKAIAGLVPDSINRIMTVERECTVFWPEALQLYAGANPMTAGYDLCLFQLDDGETYPVRNIRSPRIRIGYILTDDQSAGNLPARVNHVRVVVRNGTAELRME